jgi:hypothetical protein
VAERAERLRVLLAIFGAETALDEVGAVLAGLPYVYGEDLALMRSASPEDFALLNACLSVEREGRDRAVAAVERLLAILPLGEGGIEERFDALDLPTARLAAREIIESGLAHGPCADPADPA